MFTIGSKKWAGLSKMIEEAGELIQVCGKLMQVERLYGGHHYFGGGRDLKRDIEDEIADLMATLEFVAVMNELDETHIETRKLSKFDMFYEWHEEQSEED